MSYLKSDVKSQATATSHMIHRRKMAAGKEAAIKAGKTARDRYHPPQVAKAHTIAKTKFTGLIFITPTGLQ